MRCCSERLTPEPADVTICVIDTAAGRNISRKKRPGVLRSDFLVVNKIDLAPYVGVDVQPLRDDAARAKGPRPFVMASIAKGVGVQAIVDHLVHLGGFGLTVPMDRA